MVRGMKKVCVWVYGLFTDVPGDYIKKPMKDCTGKEITAEWLYHLGVPVDQIDDMAENSAVCVPTMMPYITDLLRILFPELSLTVDGPA